MTATVDATGSSTVEQLIAAVEELQETVKQQAGRINQLETELANHKDHTGREFADVRARITETENRQTEVDSKDATPGLMRRKQGRRPNKHRLTGSARSPSTLPIANSLLFFPLAGTLRGAGDTRTPFYARFVGVFVFMLGSSYLFSVTLGYGLFGVYIGIVLSYVCWVVVIGAGFVWGGWQELAADMMAERANLDD